MPILKNRRVVAAKIETTAGTAIALAAADAFYARDAKIDDETPLEMREDDATLGKRTGVMGPKRGKATFTVELKGSGTAGTSPLWALILLPACGMHETAGSWAFTSATANYKTLTIGIYEDGKKRQIHGAMGSFSIEGESGKPVAIKFEFTGILDAESDVALLAPEADTVKPPAFQAATFSFGAAAVAPTAKFSLASGAKVELREDFTNAGGYIAALITGRDVAGKIDPEATLVATRDYFADFHNGVEQSLSVAIGTVAGNIITVAAPKAQAKQISEGDRNGLVVNEHEFSCNKSAAAGDDELTIAFS